MWFEFLIMWMNLLVFSGMFRAKAFDLDRVQMHSHFAQK